MYDVPVIFSPAAIKNLFQEMIIEKKKEEPWYGTRRNKSQSECSSNLTTCDAFPVHAITKASRKKNDSCHKISEKSNPCFLKKNERLHELEHRNTKHHEQQTRAKMSKQIKRGGEPEIEAIIHDQSLFLPLPYLQHSPLTAQTGGGGGGHGHGRGHDGFASRRGQATPPSMHARAMSSGSCYFSKILVAELTSAFPLVRSVAFLCRRVRLEFGCWC